MTCFWDALVHGLKSSGISFVTDRLQTIQLSSLDDVYINGEALSPTEKKECMEWVQTVCPQDKTQGYWCSTSDPVLVAVCAVFSVNITHDLHGSTTHYTTTKEGTHIHLVSNHGHCVCVRGRDR